MAEQPSATPVQSAPKIPDRLFFRIGDVGELVGVETYVLRFWETEFPTLMPKKTSNGQRQYRRKDVETVLEIKRLLYDEGYTIAGARKVLQDRSRRSKKSSAAQKAQNALPFSGNEGDSANLRSIKAELEQILELLGND